MVIEFFNVFWIFFLKHSLFGFRLDTSRLPFSILARFGLFYNTNFYFNIGEEYNADGDCVDEVIDIIIPYILDIRIEK